MLSKTQCWRCEDTSEILTKCSRCNLAQYCSRKCLQNDQWRHKVACDNASLKFDCFACKKTGAEMQQCSNCLLAWFCSKECLKKGWVSHKAECTEESSKTVQLVKQLEMVYTHLRPETGKVYYWGNMPAIDLINLPMNEGEAFQGPLSLLLCGVADPRSVCLSLASLPDTYGGRVTFVLNDICACALARTVLLLYLLLKGGPRQAKAVTQIWYSLHLSDQDHAFLVSALQDLIRISNLEVITHGIMSVDADQFRRLKMVWSMWLSLVGQNLGLDRQRLNAIHSDVGSEDGMKTYEEGMPQEHKDSIREWFSHGILLPSYSARSSTQENVTLTGQYRLDKNEGNANFQYAVPTDELPFTCWDYKAARRAFPGIVSVQELYSKYITQVLEGAAKRLQDSNTAKIVINLGDCLNLPRDLPEGSKFDRISTNNLWDFIALPRLLGIAKLLLNPDNPLAVVLTSTQNWCLRHFPDIPFNVGIQAGLPNCLNFLGLPVSDMRKAAMKDTGNTAVANWMGQTGFVEYYNFTNQFLRYLRASLISASEQPPKFLPSLKQLTEAQGFALRDPTRLENRVTPFRWAINCRRITMMNGFELELEWLLPN